MGSSGGLVGDVHEAGAGDDAKDGDSGGGAKRKAVAAAGATATRPAVEAQAAPPRKLAGQDDTVYTFRGAAQRTKSSTSTDQTRRHRDRRARGRRGRRRTGGFKADSNNSSSSGGGGGGGGRRRDSRLGLSTPKTDSATHKAFLSHGPSKKVGSWLAFWSGGANVKTQRRLGKGKGTDRGTDAGQDASKDETVPTPSVRPQPKRLGKAELGKYADEDHMPEKVFIYLKSGWGIRRKDIIPVLEDLLKQSKQTEYAYLCDPCVQHVSRLPKEGPFCGYRNIQTMFSYIVSAGLPGHDRFGGALPSIFEIQDLIEKAWDEGYNSQGRIETGGVRGTRKYIGTPEAVAVLQSLGVRFAVRALNNESPAKVRDMLLEDVEQYFKQGVVHTGPGEKSKVRSTRLPPIYWQQPGHSLTIVGIERTMTSDTNLLVLDPNFMEAPAKVALLGGQRRARKHFPDQLLQTYRRGPQHVAKWKAAEILKLHPRERDVVAPETSQAGTTKDT